MGANSRLGAYSNKYGMLASFGGGTNSHFLLLINELYSSSKASFHSFELLLPKASFKDCGSSFFWMKSVGCFSLSAWTKASHLLHTSIFVGFSH